MSDEESNKTGKSSALLSIACAYSDSESSNEDEDSSKATTTFGSLVESLRADAKEKNSKELSEEASSRSEAVANEKVKTDAVEPAGKVSVSDEAQSVTKIVRLDSGKVVKISTSPIKSDSLANETQRVEVEKNSQLTSVLATSVPAAAAAPVVQPVKESVAEKADASDSFKIDEPVKGMGSLTSTLSGNVAASEESEGCAVALQESEELVGNEEVGSASLEVCAGKEEEVACSKTDKPEESVVVEEPVEPLKVLPLEQERVEETETPQSGITVPASVEVESIENESDISERLAEKKDQRVEVNVAVEKQPQVPEEPLEEEKPVTEVQNKQPAVSILEKIETVEPVRDGSDTVQVQVHAEVVEEASIVPDACKSGEPEVSDKASREASQSEGKTTLPKSELSHKEDTAEDLPDKKDKVAPVALTPTVPKITLHRIPEVKLGESRKVIKEKSDVEIVDLESEEETPSVSTKVQKSQPAAGYVGVLEGLEKRAVGSSSGGSSSSSSSGSTLLTGLRAKDVEVTVEKKVEPQKIVLDRSQFRAAEIKPPRELKPLPKLERIKTRPTILKTSEPAKTVEPLKIQAPLKKMEESVWMLQNDRLLGEPKLQSILEANLKKSTTTSPIKLKRNFGETSGHDFSQLEKKLRAEAPKPMPRPKPQCNSSEEIREILAKRLGSGLDISIIPAAKPASQTSMTIGELEIIARPQEASTTVQRMKSPPKPTSSSAARQLPSPPQSPYQQKMAFAQQTYQSSFANMINTNQGIFPAPSRKSPTKPRILGQESISPPYTSQLGPQKKSPGAETKKTIPLIIRKSDYEAKRLDAHKESYHDIKKIQPVRVCLEDIGPNASMVAKKLLGQSEISTDSSCSSEVPSSAPPCDSSSSSHDNATNFSVGGIDFENIIGSSVVCKETGLPPVPENANAAESPLPPAFDQVQAQPPPAVVIPVTPTPKKRGRPRKNPQLAMSTPANPIVATWPPEGMSEFPSGEKQLGRAERRRRREANKTTLPVKKKEDLDKVKTPKVDGDKKKEGEGDENGEDAEDIGDTPKKQRFTPKTPIKKKKRRQLFTMKKKPPTPRKKDAEKENFQNFEEETRMSASEGPTPISSRSANQGEESQGSSVTTEGQTSRIINKKGRMEVGTDSCKPVTVQQIVEYSWPPVSSLSHGEKPEGLMIQEQISEYLGVKSFKRKYPSIKRRPVDMEERNYLQENGFVSENMCDMGLTAVYSADIIEIMFNDFPNKFEEYRKYAREKKAKELKALREKQAAERADMDPRKEAVEATLQWNSEFNKSRLFTVLHIHPDKRFATCGRPIQPYEKVYIIHSADGKGLCVESDYWHNTIFSPECEISIHNKLDRRKRPLPGNVWQFIVGTTK